MNWPAGPVKWNAWLRSVGRAEPPGGKSDLAYHALAIVVGTLVGLISVKVGGIPVTLGVGGGVLVSGLVLRMVPRALSGFRRDAPAGAMDSFRVRLERFRGGDWAVRRTQGRGRDSAAGSRVAASPARS